MPSAEPMARESITRTSAEVRAELEQATARQTTLSARLRELEGERDAARATIGQAVARGRGADAARTLLRTIEEEADGIRHALPVLEQDVAALAGELETMLADEARASYTAAELTARAVWAQADQTLRAFATGPLAPLLAEMKAALDAAVDAERVEDRATKASPMGERRSYRATWKAYPALLGALVTLRAYAGGTLGHVDARDTLGRGLGDPFADV